MATIADVMETIRSYAPDADLQPVMQAYLLAARAHAGQTRKSGEPYITHPLAVAKILADMRMDVETIATALLHDAMEDNPITKAEMEAQIGPVITALVDGVTKIGKLKFRSKEELQAENFRKMMLAMSRDLRVILVKLADRLHNMSTLGFHGSVEKRRVIATETMEIYVPIANRLGLDKMKGELEDLCFHHLDEPAYTVIEEYLKDTQADRDAYTDRVSKALRDYLLEEGVTCKIYGRAKHRFSIHRKMQAQGMEVQDVPDMLAFRALVDNLGQCYTVLGLLHAKYPPLPDRIKDYIARPKPNGYQSLHTTLIGPEGRRIEVQIRTHEMHRVAEDGIAAHWKYKEGHLALSPAEVAKISRIRDLFESAQEIEDAAEFMATVKSELYSDEVFIFTPAGDIKRFPAGATALDFAYAVHTDVGNRCTGAKVNGRIVPLRYVLQSGDRLEILTSVNQKPSRDWLEIARTGRAIQKIRRQLRAEEVERGKVLGRDMLEAELKRFNTSIAEVTENGAFAAFLDRRSFREAEHLFSEIALGQIPLPTVARALLPKDVYQARTAEPAASPWSSLLNRIRRKSVSPVLITGEDGVLVQFARCCDPLPGEEVIGFITRGKGISVHRVDCEQLAALDPERLLPVEWDGASRDARHNSQVRLICRDRPGLLANITKVCEVAKVNINGAEARNIGDDRAICTLDLAIRDVAELKSVIRTLEKVKGVESVQRVIV